jgi:hypothetical protein
MCLFYHSPAGRIKVKIRHCGFWWRLLPIEARDSIEILWYLIPVRCTIELTEKEQWGSYPLFLKKGMPVHGRGLDISMPELK